MADIVNLESHYIGSPAPGVEIYQLPNASMQVLQDIINATWNEGLTTKEEFSAKIATALSGFLDLTAAPHVTAGSVTVPTITAPAVDIPASVTISDIYDQWATEYIEVATWLDGKHDGYLTARFPSEQTGFAKLQSYLNAAIDNPEVGMPQAVADQIWADDRDRIVKDGARASAEVLATFAAKGFALPPGAAASAVLQIAQNTQDKISESSRKVAITSVELQKYTLDLLMKVRAMADSDTAEYTKALASAPEVASRLANIGYDAQSKLISSASQFYSADTNAKEVMSKVAQYNNSTALEAAVKNQGSDLAMIENKLKAMLAEAAAIAQMCTGFINNLHVGATLQANGGTTVSNSSEF